MRPFEGHDAVVVVERNSSLAIGSATATSKTNRMIGTGTRHGHMFVG